MKKSSIRKLYWFTMVCHIFVLICCVVASVIMTVNYNNVVEKNGRVLGIIFSFCAVGLFLVLIALSTKVIIVLLKDLKSLRNNDFISIIGRVINFKKNREPESGIQINDKPIVLELSTGFKVELIINDRIVVGETYKFNYLKNCKIAEVVEKL